MPSGSCDGRPRRPRRIHGRRLLAALLFALPAAARPASAVAAQTASQEEALRLAFPGADELDRRTAYLDEGQVARAAELAGEGVEIESRVVTYYVALGDGAPLGVAYFDAHRVRTLPEVLMIVVDPDDRIRRIEVIRFSEPREYQAPEGWLAQFQGRGPEEQPSLKGDIANITGATLTAGAVTGAARRVLALHRVISPFGGGR